MHATIPQSALSILACGECTRYTGSHEAGNVDLSIEEELCEGSIAREYFSEDKCFCLGDVMATVSLLTEIPRQRAFVLLCFYMFLYFLFWD